ncbi:MAG: zinc-binding alcohol dehydrogenase family protein [Cohnella sp.]|nr:zinc-binding alcohol dehydrogenase family protein [Cohnella sp.]
MRGIVCEQAHSFRLLHDLPEPELTPGHAIVRVKRIGICGTDYHAFQGNQPFFSYPRILGHELSGIVERVEENAEGISAGDLVSVIPYMHCGVCQACRRGRTNCCKEMRVLGVHVDGGMRELISVPTTHLLKASGLSLDEAALVEPLAIGAHAVRRAEVSADDTVLVIGSGPIGLGVMVFAKHAGAAVIAMDINEERLAFCRSWAKADHTIDARAGDATQRLEALTNGEYPAIVFDATGNAGSMAKAFDYPAHGGKLVYVGLVKGEIAFSDPEFHKRELTLMGSRNATEADFRHVIAAIESRAFDLGPYITHRAAFDETLAAFDKWLKPESRVIKAIVEL